MKYLHCFNTPPDLKTNRHSHQHTLCFFQRLLFVTKVGPEGISANTIPYWMVQLLILGQPVGYVCIPNRHLEEAAVLPTGNTAGVGIKDATEAGEGDAEVTEEAAADIDAQVRTLGDLRALIGRQLDLDTDRIEIWIAPPETRSSGTFPSTRGDGDVKGNTDSDIFLPETPRGDKALLDDMGLGHYGLHHLSVVDVRLTPEAQENYYSGSEATDAEGVISGESSEADGESSEADGENSEADEESNEADGESSEEDGESSEEGEEERRDRTVRIVVMTTRMMARGEEGAVRVCLLACLL